MYIHWNIRNPSIYFSYQFLCQHLWKNDISDKDMSLTKKKMETIERGWEKKMKPKLLAAVFNCVLYMLNNHGVKSDIHKCLKALNIWNCVLICNPNNCPTAIGGIHLRNYSEYCRLVELKNKTKWNTKHSGEKSPLFDSVTGKLIERLTSYEASISHKTLIHAVSTILNGNSSHDNL